MADPTVTERAYPFAEGPGEYVTEDDWAAMTTGFQDDGVYGHPGTLDLKIQPGPDPNTIQINIGDAQLSGFHYRLTAPKVISTVANAGTTDRLDAVVLQLDRETKEILPVLLAGSGVWEIGSDRCPIGIWKQPPASAVTAEYWGEATDARWFIGNRVRPYMESAIPPAKPGALIFDPTEDGNGTVLLGRLDSNGTPYWAPWYPLASERAEVKVAWSDSDQTTKSTSFTAGSPQVSTTFEAPPSGRVLINVNAQLEADGPASAYVGFEIRNTNASGAVVRSAAQNDSAAVQEGSFVSSSVRRLVTGLTPGATYFVRTMHSSSNATYNAKIFFRYLMVEPVYTDVAPGGEGGGGGLQPSQVVLTSGGSIIRIPDGDTATRALQIRVPAGDRSSAVDSFAIVRNDGTDASPNWVRVTYMDPNGDLRVTPSGPDRVGIAVNTRSGQTANPIEVRNAATTPVAGFDGNGRLFAPNFVPVLVLGAGDPVPADTAPGTLIFRSA
ncbi:hypothetical protein [Spirillospora sp. NPDC047279]|uniref:hypothetical protein n=1 Tax=Spirillospora sp. NPDC047279 TaxID=3155478 RepID=UPI0033DB36A7